jgi:small-conductance mechanosensitive channel
MDPQIVTEELSRVISDILAIVPNLINGMIVLVIGYALAWAVRLILRFLLKRLGFDRLMDELGFSGGLRGIGVSIPISRLLAQAAFLLLLLSFAVTATRLMRLQAVADILERFLGFLPSIIAAAIVFLIGSLAASYVGEQVGRAGRASRLGFAAVAGRAVQFLLFFFAIVLAVGVLGVDTAILVTVITVTVGALGLTLSLALGLGARSLMLDILAGYYVRERFPVGRRITLDEVSGEVSGVGSVNTTVTAGDETVVIPNSLLIKQIVRVERRAAPSEPPTV